MLSSCPLQLAGISVAYLRAKFHIQIITAPKLEERKMPNEYKIQVEYCDVPVSGRSSLRSFRDKRLLWLNWIDDDEHHAISQVLSSMAWADVSFRTLSQLANDNDNSALHNYLLSEALINGHFATQILSLRRLVDNRKDVISIHRLLKDVRSNLKLFTRENYVCFDGLPYDHEAAQARLLEKNIGKQVFWGPTSGPDAYGTSQLAHQRFDKLTGVSPEMRKRDDRIPKRMLDRLDSWLLNSGAEDMAKWSHAFLAHAGGPETRVKLSNVVVSLDKITNAIKELALIVEAVSNWLLWSGGLANNMVPLAQFDQFEKLDQPVINAGKRDDIEAVWKTLSDERNKFLDPLDDMLFEQS